MVSPFEILRLNRAVLAALVPLTSCCGFEALKPAEAAPECPAVTNAEAWINGMPAVGERSGKLVVSLEFDAQEKWMLTRTSGDDDPALVLDLRPGGPSQPGRAAYSKALAGHPVSSVDVTCGGKLISRIDTIRVVR